MMKQSLLILLFLAVLGCSPKLSNEQVIYLGEDIARMLHETFTPNPVIEAVRLDDFPLLDKSYYQEMTDAFKAAGFQYAGDLELKHISRRDAAFKTCLRTFISPDKTSSAAIWELHKSPHLPEGMRFIELETLFTDGHWVATQNNTMDKLNPDPERVTLHLLDTGSVTRMISEHERRKGDYLAAHGVRAVEVRDLFEIIQRQQKQAVDEAAYRKRIGGLTDKELDALNPGLSKNDIKRLLENIQQSFRAKT